jgi:sigma-E factor negative regulatory protein RseB
MRWFAALAAGLILLSPIRGFAQVSNDPLSWLGRIATAGQRLNYTGTFIYQSGGGFETSRITHLTDASGEHERLEVLDGSPREVIRNNREVRCVLPDQKTVIIDRSGGQRAFPSRLPESYASLAESYRISLGDISRVAGFDAQLVVLEPRDELRYGHEFWAEVNSGLLLKARLVDENGRAVEQFAFTDVTIGGKIDAEALLPRFQKGDDWRIIDAQGNQLPVSEAEWGLAANLPGYTLKSIVKRPLGRDSGDILHMVYSDGLAAVSVFVEPVDAERFAGGLGPLSTGPINIYKRVVGESLITVLGEVPLVALQRLGEGMERTR